jgi:hypothetical protein
MPPPEIIDGEEEYEAEGILEYRRYRRQHQFLILWKGYPRSSATWEPLGNLSHCLELVNEFKTAHSIKF